MIVKAADLVAKFRYAIDKHWGYIWGRYGQLWTQANQNAATREQTVKYGQRWVGHHVADCSGLGYWAFKELGGYIYHGSNTIWNKYVTGRCDLRFGVRTDGAPILAGDPVFKRRTENGTVNRHHIGYFVGGDTVIEAKGTQSGVVTSKLSEWHETAHWLNVEYEGGKIFVEYPILKRGNSGPSVVTMQSLLVKAGYALPPSKSAEDGVDGIFGVNTEAVLKQFQQDHGLTPDGICGQATWDALTGSTAQNDDTVTVGRDELAQQRKKLEEVAAWINAKLEG